MNEIIENLKGRTLFQLDTTKDIGIGFGLGDDISIIYGDHYIILSLSGAKLLATTLLDRVNKVEALKTKSD
jgi:hypothetical protein